MNTLNKSAANVPDTITCDVIVLGSGAAGLAAALTASLRGLDTIVIEKAAVFGGASAISGGAIWIPGTDQAKDAKLDSSLELARTYLQNMVGTGFDPELVDAYLARGSEALRFLEKNSELAFRVRPVSPDYHPEVEGASKGGRTLEILEYDGSRLGAHFRQLRKPPAGMLLFGGMMVNRVDIQHFLNISRSPTSLWHCIKLMARYGFDRLRHPRGTRLTVGNALVARLAASVLERGVPLWLETEAQSLIVEERAVRGALLQRSGKTVRVLARGGVVLATGGYGAAPAAAQDRPSGAHAHWSMSPETNTGGGLGLGQSAGAALGQDLASNFFWAPVSVLRLGDGSIEKFPHLVTDRAKPGIIAINQAGQRFVNEADSYHRFVLAMQSDVTLNAPCHLVCDATAMKAYGMGLARPGPSDNTPLVRAGYLRQAGSLQELAAMIGVDGQALATTVERYNADAIAGRDTAFGKGSTVYNVSMGDPNHRPNACLAPLLKAPFYAIRLDTGDLGSARGLRTDGHARALDADGQPIAGLYAAGNDMNSLMDGTYPGPGITLGPALTFGYIAASDMADKLAKTA